MQRVSGGGQLSNTRPDVAHALRDEVPRQRLIEALAERWNRRLVLIEAPAGYGKSTAIAQAIRDNEQDPSGFDLFVRLRASMLDAGDVVTSLADQLGVGEAESVHSVIDAIGARSPHDVAVTIDDMHLVDHVPGLLDVLMDLLDAMPVNGHLVLSGRSMPKLRTARLAAGDQLLRIARSDLAFTASEAAELAAAHGVDVSAIERTDGWPALTRLAIASGPDRPSDFLIEEIADGLSAQARLALATAVIAAPASPELLRSVGVTTPSSDLLREVPLLFETADGLSAHDLWHEVSGALFDDLPAVDLARTVRRNLSEDGAHHRALTVALAHELWDDALTEIVDGMLTGDAEVDVVLTRRWLDALPADYLGEPEGQLLSGFHARLAGDVSSGTDEIRAAADAFEAAGRLDAAACCVNELGLRGWLTGDRELWREAGERSRRLIDAGSDRMKALSAVGTVGRRDLRGDFAGAIQAYEERPGFLEHPDELGARHCSTLAFLAGDVVRCRHYLDLMVERWPKRLLAGHRRMVLWQLGDPEPLLSYGAVDHGSFTNQRNELLAAVFSNMVRSNLGLPVDAAAVESVVWERSREQTYLALVRAAADLHDRDISEVEVGHRLDKRLQVIGLDDPLPLGELRRFTAYGYVLSAAVRERLDAEDGGGPVFEESRGLARALLRARAGDVIGVLPAEPKILTWLPLVWSVELACRLAATDDARGVSLAEYLADTCGPIVHHRLRELTEQADGDPATRRGAEVVLRVVPSPPGAPLVVDLVGTVAVTRADGRPAAIARSRVRQLLQLLALRQRWTRDALIDALWPDLEPDKARANLRATLAHVRRELEPERTAREAPFHLRQRGNEVWLHRSEHLVIDLWRLRTDLRTADEQFDELSLGALRSHLTAWSAQSLADVRDLDVAASEVRLLERSLLDAGCRASEHLVATADPTQAADLADLVLAIDHTSERAHNARIKRCSARANSTEQRRRSRTAST